MDGSEDIAVELCAKDNASITFRWRHWQERPLSNLQALCNTTSLSSKPLLQLISVFTLLVVFTRVLVYKGFVLPCGACGASDSNLWGD
jgi:hypothetical protein